MRTTKIITAIIATMIITPIMACDKFGRDYENIDGDMIGSWGWFYTF